MPNLLQALSLQPEFFRRHTLALELLERPQTESLSPRQHAMVRALVSTLTRCQYSAATTRRLVASACAALGRPAELEKLVRDRLAGAPEDGAARRALPTPRGPPTWAARRPARRGRFVARRALWAPDRGARGVAPPPRCARTARATRPPRCSLPCPETPGMSPRTRRTSASPRAHRRAPRRAPRHRAPARARSPRCVRRARAQWGVLCPWRARLARAPCPSRTPRCGEAPRRSRGASRRSRGAHAPRSLTRSRRPLAGFLWPCCDAR